MLGEGTGAGGVCCGTEVGGDLGPCEPDGIWGQRAFRKSKGSESCEELRVVPLQPDPEPAMTLNKGQHAPNLSVFVGNGGPAVRCAGR